MRLTVKPLKIRRPGSGMAVIDRTVLRDIGVSSGDFVELRGGSSVVARVWPSDAEDAGIGIVRIDGQSGRRLASVSTTASPSRRPMSNRPGTSPSHSPTASVCAALSARRFAKS